MLPKIYITAWFLFDSWTTGGLLKTDNVEHAVYYPFITHCCHSIFHHICNNQALKILDFPVNIMMIPLCSY